MQSAATAPRAIVAIPARDEAERIGACLSALVMQRQEDGAPLAPDALEILVLANNCHDATADVARDFAARSPFRLTVVECRLGRDSAHAGGARRAAMDCAADRLDAAQLRDGVLLTTDADSRAGPTWVSASLRAIRGGVDAVAGYIDADPSEYLALGRGFLDRGRLEDRVLAKVAEVYARLDPRPHDPWPNHAVHSGAAFAVTLAAYRAIGGLPARPLGEDAALGEALEQAGFLIRHSFEAAVLTSCRFDGRAPGGAGDTMRHRHADLDAPCDDVLEPAAALLRRARARGALRALHLARQLDRAGPWWARLGLSREWVIAQAGPAAGRPFAQLWAEIEAASPALRRGLPLHPSDLARELPRLDRLLARLRRPRPETRAGNGIHGALPQRAAAAQLR